MFPSAATARYSAEANKTYHIRGGQEDLSKNRSIARQCSDLGVLESPKEICICFPDRDLGITVSGKRIIEDQRI